MWSRWFRVCVLVSLAPFALADAAQADIAADDLLQHEEAWPFHVKLVEDWTPPGSDSPLRSRTPGVLIRVMESRLARIARGLKRANLDGLDALGEVVEFVGAV